MREMENRFLKRRKYMIECLGRMGFTEVELLVVDIGWRSFALHYKKGSQDCKWQKINEFFITELLLHTFVLLCFVYFLYRVLFIPCLCNPYDSKITCENLIKDGKSKPEWLVLLTLDLVVMMIYSSESLVNKW